MSGSESRVVERQKDGDVRERIPSCGEAKGRRCQGVNPELWRGKRTAMSGSESRVVEKAKGRRCQGVNPELWRCKRTAMSGSESRVVEMQKDGDVIETSVYAQLVSSRAAGRHFRCFVIRRDIDWRSVGRHIPVQRGR